MKRLFTKQIEDHVKEHGHGLTTKDLTALVNGRFGTGYSEKQIYHLRHRLGVNPPTDGRFQKGSQIGVKYRFKPGQVPANKGKTWDEMGIKQEAREGTAKAWFKKGSIPANHLPVGTRTLRTKDGYIWQKIAEPNRWIPAHRVIWEENHGPIPKGMCVTFLDGDRTNLRLDNLALISQKENRVLNNGRAYQRTEDAALSMANIMTMRLSMKIKEKTGNEKEHDSRPQ